MATKKLYRVTKRGCRVKNGVEIEVGETAMLSEQKARSLVNKVVPVEEVLSVPKADKTKAPQV